MPTAGRASCTVTIHAAMWRTRMRTTAKTMERIIFTFQTVVRDSVRGVSSENLQNGATMSRLTRRVSVTFSEDVTFNSTVAID